jgi:hypothetical protein
MVAHRWKLLTLELASWIEDKWKQGQKMAQMKDYVHVRARFGIPCLHACIHLHD